MSTHVPVYQEPTFMFVIPVKKEVKMCQCDVLVMEPAEVRTGLEKRWRDSVCGRMIPRSHVVEYDRYFGFNGFDEVNDCE